MPGDILETVNNYYTQKIREHGLTPRGVDWNSAESQELRFSQLSKVIDTAGRFSVLDYGCGYGALYDYFRKNQYDFRYVGFDISEEMIRQATAAHTGAANSQWISTLDDGMSCDYAIASGIFNVRMQHSEEEWKNYILDTLRTIDRNAAKGFSFNMLTSYSDKEYMRDYLYYADPAFYFDFCKRNFSKYAAVLHDYPLYEFTLIV